MDKYDTYNLILNCGWPISFLSFLLSFLGILITIGIIQNTNIFLISGIIVIILDILWIIYIWLFPFEHLDERFILWIHSFKKYKLNEHEIKLWANIMNNADIGYKEWYEQTKGDDMCGPWIKNYTEEEGNLIDKIHKHFYGEHWHITMSISASQCYYQMYYDIKDKIN